MVHIYTEEELLSGKELPPFMAKKAPEQWVKTPKDRRIKFYTTEEINKLTDESERRPPPEDRGFFKETGSLVARGALGAGETWARALRTADPEGGIDWVEDVATSGIESLEETRAQTPFLQPTPKSTKGWRRWVSGGVESAVQSLVSRIPGTAAGALLGSTFGPPGTVIGALIGYVTTGAVLFGVAEYDRAFEEAEKKGIPRAEAQTYAVLSGLAEGGLEAAADVIELFTFKLTKPLMQPAKKALKAGIKELFKTRLTQHMIRLGSIVTAETSTEMTTAGVQAELARDVGLGDEKFWAAAKHAFGPAFVASTIFFGIGSTVSGLQRRDIAKSLKDTGVDKKDRIRAVNKVYRTLKDVDPDIASVWKMNATITVNKGESIDMGEDLVTATSEFMAGFDKTVEKEAPIDQSGISDNQGAIKDIATDTVRKSRTAEVEGRRLKAEEERIRTEEGQAAGVLSEIIAEEEAAKRRTEDESATLTADKGQSLPAFSVAGTEEGQEIRTEEEQVAAIEGEETFTPAVHAPTLIVATKRGRVYESKSAQNYADLLEEFGLNPQEVTDTGQIVDGKPVWDERQETEVGGLPAVSEAGQRSEVGEQETEIRDQRSEIGEREITEYPEEQQPAIRTADKPATPATRPAGKVAVTSPQVPSERQLAPAVEEGAPALEEQKSEIRSQRSEVGEQRAETRDEGRVEGRSLPAVSEAGTEGKLATRTASKYTKEQLEGVVVKISAVRERTGEIITIEENAETALNDANDRVDAFKKLLECLSG